MNKLCLSLIIFLLTCCLSPVFCESASGQAQTGKEAALGGQFVLEGPEVKKDPYEAGEAEALDFFNAIQNNIPQLSTGASAKITSPEEKAIHFLTGLYLYCVVKDGACPFLLDSMLEADIINARVSKGDQCPIMRSFWKRYIENDMENRHQFLTKIGHMGVTTEFNKSSRPKHIKCAETVKSTVNPSGSDSEFFKSRYQDGKIKEALAKSIDLVSRLKAKKINVFNEVETLK